MIPDFSREVLKSRHWDALVDFLVYTSDEFRGRVDKLLESTNQYLFFEFPAAFMQINMKKNLLRDGHDY